VKAVRVVFPDRPAGKYASGEYDFRTDLDLNVGDLVVCDVCYQGENCYTNGRVIRVMEQPSTKAVKWVVQKIDLEAHMKRLELQSRIAAVKAKMERRRKELQDIEIYKELAQHDEEMSGMLKQLLDLEGNN
jgi:hypothetical protein